MARRLLVAGATVWFVRWLASPPERLPDAGAPAEPKPARDDWEFPEPKLAPAELKRVSRRFATTLALTAIFFAGAALAAGAGNEVAKLSADSSGAAASAATTDTTDTTDATPTTVAAADGAPPPADTAAASTDAPTTSADPTTPAAPAPAPAPAPADPSQAQPDGSPDSTPAPQPAPAASPPATAATTTDAPPDATTDPTATDPTAATPAPVPPADQPTGDTTAAPTASSSDPMSAPATATKPRPATRPKRHASVHRPTTAAARPHARQLQNLPLVVPYHALAFNPQAWLNDNPGTPTGQAAVAIAMNYLGVPYRWGGAVPATGFDCSGLVRYVYAQLGINLVHYAASQFAAFPKLDPAQLAPGDLVFFEPKADGPGHVAMYIGHDEMIEAPHTGAVVRISSFSGAAAAMGFLGAVRPYATPAPTLALMSQVEWGPASPLFRLQ